MEGNPIDVVLDAFKKGYATSEFWLVLVASVYNAVVLAWDPTKGWKDQISGAVIAGAVAIYTLARSGLKMRRATALTAVIAAQSASTSVIGQLTDPGSNPPTDATPKP